MSLTLYHVSWCPECAVVREKLEALHLDYTDVVVPDFRSARRQVFEVSGQYYVPVLADDELVLTETRDILQYLDERYGAQGGEAASAKWKTKSARHASSGLDESDDYPSCGL